MDLLQTMANIERTGYNVSAYRRKNNELDGPGLIWEVSIDKGRHGSSKYSVAVGATGATFADALATCFNELDIMLSLKADRAPAQFAPSHHPATTLDDDIPF